LGGCDSLFRTRSAVAKGPGIFGFGVGAELRK